MRYNRFVILSGLLAILFGGAQIVSAAQDQQKQQAANAGLKWLAQTQGGNGSWASSMSYTIGTAASVKAFVDRGYQPGNTVIIGGTNYGDVVGRGMTYLFNQMAPMAIGPQQMGNPDVNGNGLGVCSSINSGSQHIYTTSLTAMAMIATGRPDSIVTSGSQAGRTYGAVVQDMLDYLSYAQNDPSTGYYRGGWGYSANFGTSYQECAPWAALAISDAKAAGFGVVPQFVVNELDTWSQFVQYYNGAGSGYDGSSGFASPTYYNNEAMTGGLLTEFSLTGHTADEARVQAAMGYLNRQWKAPLNPLWNGNLGNHYTMWQVAKGMNAMVGLEDASGISNLRGPGDLDPGVAANWYQDYCQYLVDTQQASGAWPNSGYDPTVSTAWSVDILSGVPVPEPTSLMLLLSAGAVSVMCAFRRQWRTCRRSKFSIFDEQQ